MKGLVWKHIGLSTLSAILLTIPWRIPHTGWLLLAAFVPLLWLEADFTLQKRKGCWRYYAWTFLLWNALTCYWVYKATLAGGIFAVVANAFEMFVIFALFRYVKKKTSPKIGYLFFATLWIAWEYFYFDAEISWPWLVLGNGFAETPRLIQWYEFTGVLGGSLWVFLSNLLFFHTFRNKEKGSLKPLNAISPRQWIPAVMVLILPVIGSVYRFYTYKEVVNPVEVVVLQPNIDPYKDKFARPQEVQDAALLRLAQESISPSTQYIFAPETFVSGVNENNMSENQSFRRFYQFLEHHPDLRFIVGATSWLQYPKSSEKPSPTAKNGTTFWYDTFNTSFQLRHAEPPLAYHKSKLVVGTEKQPYAEYLEFLNSFAVNLGGAAGSFGTQPEAGVFPGTSCSIGATICYESVYGEYFASFVKKGAGLMAIITNDGWWGNTPGYHQHLSYARLRAIETRRSIARSANTGISALINQRGDYLQRTKWWEETYLKGTLNINQKQTFYVRYGDMIGRVAVYLLWLILVYCFVVHKYKPVRK